MANPYGTVGFASCGKWDWRKSHEFQHALQAQSSIRAQSFQNSPPNLFSTDCGYGFRARDSFRPRMTATPLSALLIRAACGAWRTEVRISSAPQLRHA